VPGADAEGEKAPKGEKAPADDTLDRGGEDAGADAPVPTIVEFIPSEYFKGAKPGYVFKAGEKGVGYYPDANPAPAKGSDKDGGREKKRSKNAKKKKRKSSSSSS
jgi:hypothetical protein